MTLEKKNKVVFLEVDDIKAKQKFIDTKSKNVVNFTSYVYMSQKFGLF